MISQISDQSDNYPLVSIVVITFNSAHFVLETLESAKAQTYQNIELIVSDDCSTDDTVEICCKWIKENAVRFTSVELITSPINTGIPANCNRGVRAAQGDWIKLIAGDDILFPGCITDNLNYVSINTECQILYSDIEWFNEHGILRNNFDNIDLERMVFGQLNSGQQLKFYSRWPIFLNVPSVFYKKDLIIKLNYYNESLKVFEDQYLFLKVLIANYKIYHNKLTTVKYRRHSSTVGSNLDQRYLSEIIFLFKNYRRKNLKLFNFTDFCYLMEHYIFVLHQYVYIHYFKFRHLFKILKYIKLTKLFKLQPWD